MPRGLKVSRPLIANMISFINISNFFQWKNIYIMTFRAAQWIWMIVMRFSMQGEDIFEHTNGKCHVFTF